MSRLIVLLLPAALLLGTARCHQEEPTEEPGRKALSPPAAKGEEPAEQPAPPGRKPGPPGDVVEAKKDRVEQPVKTASPDVKATALKQPPTEPPSKAADVKSESRPADTPARLPGPDVRTPPPTDVVAGPGESPPGPGPGPDARARTLPDAATTARTDVAPPAPAVPPDTMAHKDGAPAAPPVDAERSKKVFDEARKFIEEGKLNKATELLEEWLKLTPMDLINRKNLIHVYMKLQKYGEAEVHLRFMAGQFEEEAEWWAHLGRVQARLDKFAPAVESLARAWRLAPDDIDVGLDLARVHATRKDFDSARRVLEKALKLDKKVPDVLKDLAASLVELGEYNKAFAHYRRLQRAAPSYEVALIMAGIAARYERCDDVVDSLARWDQEFADEKPHLLLGTCALRGDNVRKAEKHFKQGLARNEKCFDCSLKLGDVYFTAGNWPEAIKYYGIAAPLQPQDYRPFVQLGKALANSGKHIEASRAFAAANERKPADPEIVYMLGVEWVKAGEKAKAWDVWGALDELDRNRARELKKMLLK